MKTDESLIKEILTLLEQGQRDKLLVVMNDLDPADLADLLEEMPSEERDHIFQMLDMETASDVLVELEHSYKDEVVETMTSDQLADLADLMAPDDAADLISELDEDQRPCVLAAMREQEEVSELLRYEEDTAGSIMTSEVCAMFATATVQEARQALTEFVPDDPIFYVYIVEPGTRTLLGLVPLTQMVSAAAEPAQTLGDIADLDFVCCHVEDDQEEVARKFRKYDLWVLPVIEASGRLVGRITVDDIIDVVHEEADEDLAHMVGAPDIEIEEESPLRIVQLRLPWLMITMFAGLVNSMIITSMLNVTQIVAIAVFVPAILAMGGNTGMQSSAIAVRGLALGLKKYSKMFEIVFREVRVGACLGGCCGIVAAICVWGTLLWLHPDTGGLHPAALAFAVGAAMFNSMVFASAYGAIVPILLHRMKVDPAVASGPFVTTSNDLSSSLIYFLTCLLVLRML